MAGALKKTTRLAGLVVSQHPQMDLSKLYKRTLRVLEKLPQDSTYRVETEKIIKDRLKIVRETSDAQAIENKIACGQVEELLLQAMSEMRLAEKMVGWKPWEKLMQEAPPNQWTWPPHK